MDFVNKHNDQFIQTRVASKEGVRCPQKGGNPYGVTMDSLAADVNSGMGKLRASPSNHYNNCPQKGGGGHNYDDDFGGVGYGYTQSGASIANELKGSYAPITKARSSNMCGGRKKRHKSRRKRRKSRRKRRKSRRKRRKSRRKRAGEYSPLAKNLLKKESTRDDSPLGHPSLVGKNLGKVSLSRGKESPFVPKKVYSAPSIGLVNWNPRAVPTKTHFGGKKRSSRRSRKSNRRSRKSNRRSRKSKSKRGYKRFRRSRKKQRGGAYSQYGSNVPNTPSYSSPDTSGSMPWATGPVSITRHMRCGK